MKTSRFIALLVYLFSFFSIFYVHHAIAEDAISPSLTAFNYTFFLKSCSNEDPHHFYEELLESHSALYPIVRLGKPGSYHYELLLENSDSPILFTSAYDALAYKLWKESAFSIEVTQNAFFSNADSFLDSSELVGITRLYNNRVSPSDPLLKSSILTFSINPNVSLHEVDDATAQPVSLETLESASASLLIGLTLFAGATYGCYKVENAWHDYRQKTYCQEFQDLRGGNALTRISVDQNREMTQTLFTSFPSSLDPAHQQLAAEDHVPVSDSMYGKVLKYITEDIPHGFFNETLEKAINENPDVHSLIKECAHRVSQKLGVILSKIPRGDLRDKFVIGCQNAFKKIDNAYGRIKNNALVLYQLEGINNNIPEINDAISSINDEISSINLNKKESIPPTSSFSLKEPPRTHRTPSKTTSENPRVSFDSSSLTNNNTSNSKKVKSLVVTPKEEILDINQELATRVLLNPKAALEKQLLCKAKELYQDALPPKSTEHTSNAIYHLRNSYERIASLIKERANKAETFDSPSNRKKINSLISDIKSLCASHTVDVSDIQDLNSFNNEFNNKLSSLSTIMQPNNKDTGNDHALAKRTESLNAPSPQAHHAELLVNLLIEANHTRNISLSTDTSKLPEFLEQSTTHLNQAFENLQKDILQKEKQDNELDRILCFLKSAIYYRKAFYHDESNSNNSELVNSFKKTAEKFSSLAHDKNLQYPLLEEQESLHNEFVHTIVQQINHNILKLPIESKNYEQFQKYLHFALHLYANIPKEKLLSDSLALRSARDSLHSLIDAANTCSNNKENLATLHAHQAYASWMMFQNQLNQNDPYHYNAWNKMYNDVSNAITAFQIQNVSEQSLQMHLNTVALSQRKAEGSFIDFIYSRLFSNE